MGKMCVLEERSCIDCGKCLYCDIDPEKICDNCCVCLGDSDYTGVEIDEILQNIELAVKKVKD